MGIGTSEIILILIVAFIVFGGKRLPDIGAGLGKSIRSFNKGLKGELDDDKKDGPQNPDQNKKAD